MTCLPIAVQGVLWEFAGPMQLSDMIQEAFTFQDDWFDEIGPKLIGNDEEEIYCRLKIRNEATFYWHLILEMEHADWECSLSLRFQSLEKIVAFEPRLRALLPAAVDFPTPMLALADEEWEHLLGMDGMSEFEDWVSLSTRAEFLQELKDFEEGAQS